MSKNISEVYTANPSTTLAGDDLFYLGLTPYGATDDSAIKWSDILLEITAGAAGGSDTEVLYNNSGAIDSISGFTTDGSNYISVDSIPMLMNTAANQVGIECTFSSDFSAYASTSFATSPSCVTFGNSGSCTYPTSSFALSTNFTGQTVANTTQTINTGTSQVTSSYFGSIYSANNTNDISAFELYANVNEAAWPGNTTAGTMVANLSTVTYQGKDNGALIAGEIGGSKVTTLLAPPSSSTQTVTSYYGSLTVLQKTTASTTTNTCNLTSAGACAAIINIDNDGDATDTAIGALSLYGSAGIFLSAAGAGSSMAITNFFGMYLPSLTVGANTTITNRFGIYQEDTSSTNSFAGPIVASSTITPSQTAGIVGTTTNNDADAGSVGELLSTVVLVGSAVSLTTATAANIATLSLTAGDWDVWGELWTSPDGTTTTSRVQVAISATTATLPTVPAEGTTLTNLGGISVPAGESMTAPTNTTRVSLSGTTNYYLVASVDFAVSTMGGYGAIFARRVR